MFSNALNYQAKLISLLGDFLQSQNIGNKTIANYKSDLKHFLLWFTGIAESRVQAATSEVQFVQAIKSADIETYRNVMYAERTPASTVNRRLSALRAFGKCLVAAGWITKNPLDTIQNVQPDSPKPLSESELIAAFEAYLKNEGAADSTVKTYKADVETFLRWNLPDQS